MSLRRFLRYELVPQLGRDAWLEGGFVLVNSIGSVDVALIALQIAAFRVHSEQATRP